MHWIYLIHKFHNLSWITEINELFHNILIYWDAPVYAHIQKFGVSNIIRTKQKTCITFYLTLWCETSMRVWVCVKQHAFSDCDRGRSVCVEDIHCLSVKAVTVIITKDPMDSLTHTHTHTSVHLWFTIMACTAKYSCPHYHTLLLNRIDMYSHVKHI